MAKLIGQNDPPKRKIDAYICPDLHVVLTECMDEGKVPPTIKCLQCGQVAQSQGFNVNQNFKAAVEWYKPTDADILRVTSGMQKPEANRLIEMTNKGLLLSRPKPGGVFDQSKKEEKAEENKGG